MAPTALEAPDKAANTHQRKPPRNTGTAHTNAPPPRNWLKGILDADGRALTRDQLLDGIHGAGEGDVLDRAVDVYIKRLREKLDDDANAPRYVATVRGVGYRAAGRVERRPADTAS